MFKWLCKLNLHAKGLPVSVILTDEHGERTYPLGRMCTRCGTRYITEDWNHVARQISQAYTDGKMAQLQGDFK